MENEEISFGRLVLRGPELWRDGRAVRIHRRALGILRVLAEAKGEIVSKDELLARLWPGRAVEEGNLHVHISALRKSLDEHGEGRDFVVTVPGRGYRLAGLSGEDYAFDSTVGGFSSGASGSTSTSASCFAMVSPCGFTATRWASCVR